MNNASFSKRSGQLPPALTTIIVRYTVKKFSGGREDVLPDDIDDPELLLRALVGCRVGSVGSAGAEVPVRAGAQAQFRMRRAWGQLCS